MNAPLSGFDRSGAQRSLDLGKMVKGNNQITAPVVMRRVNLFHGQTGGLAISHCLPQQRPVLFVHKTAPFLLVWPLGDDDANDTA